MVQAGVWVQEAPPARRVGKGLHAPVLRPLLYDSHEPMSNRLFPTMRSTSPSIKNCIHHGWYCVSYSCLLAVLWCMSFEHALPPSLGYEIACNLITNANPMHGDGEVSCCEDLCARQRKATAMLAKLSLLMWPRFRSMKSDAIHRAG